MLASRYPDSRLPMVRAECAIQGQAPPLAYPRFREGVGGPGTRGILGIFGAFWTSRNVDFRVLEAPYPILLKAERLYLPHFSHVDQASPPPNPEKKPKKE